MRGHEHERPGGRQEPAHEEQERPDELGRPGRRQGKRGRSSEPQELGGVLDALLQTRPWGPGVILGELGRRWASVVGERLAEECSPARLDAGVLLVRASSAAWAAQLRFLSNEVRERANAVLGEDRIREVRVTLGEGRGHG